MFHTKDVYSHVRLDRFKRLVTWHHLENQRLYPSLTNLEPNKDLEEELNCASDPLDAALHTTIQCYIDMGPTPRIETHRSIQSNSRPYVYDDDLYIPGDSTRFARPEDYCR